MGIIDRRRAAGTFPLLPSGSAGKLVLYSKGIASVLPALVTSGYQQIQNAGGVGIGTSILLASIFPEGQEGVNAVNDSVGAIRVGVCQGSRGGDISLPWRRCRIGLCSEH